MDGLIPFFRRQYSLLPCSLSKLNNLSYFIDIYYHRISSISPGWQPSNSHIFSMFLQEIGSPFRMLVSAPSDKRFSLRNRNVEYPAFFSANCTSILYFIGIYNHLFLLWGYSLNWILRICISFKAEYITRLAIYQGTQPFDCIRVNCFTFYDLIQHSGMDSMVSQRVFFLIPLISISWNSFL